MRQQGPDEARLCHGGWLLAGIALAVAGQARAADWTIQPRVEVGEVYTDNVELTADENDDFITELTPGIMIRREATQFQAEADYQLQNLWYVDNNDFDDHFHQFNGRAGAQFLDGSLTLDGSAIYDQENIDPERAIAFSNILQTDNRSDVFRTRITPTYVGSLAPAVDTRLTYSYYTTNYRNTDNTTVNVEDSDRHFLSAVVGDLKDPGRIDWQGSYLFSRTEFDDNGRTFEYQRAGGLIGYAINTRTRLLFSAGRESDIEDSVSAGDLDAYYWDVGFSWIPNSRQSLEARAGERYFGTSYFFEWTRQARRTRLNASYTEEAVTTNDQLFVLDTSGLPPGLARARLDTDVYILRRFTAGFQLETVKSTFDFNTYYDDREYQLSDRNEQYAGLSVTWTWELGRRTTLRSLVASELRNLRDDDDLYRFRVTLERQLSRVFEGRVTIGRLVRNAETGTDDYRANGGAIYVTARF